MRLGAAGAPKLEVRMLPLEEVAQVVGHLASRCSEDGLRPPYVLGILRGGLVPAQYFSETLEALGSRPRLLQYRIQRGSTGRLKTLLVRLLKNSPPKFLDTLRIAEMRFHSMLQARRRSNTDLLEIYDEGLLTYLQSTIDPGTLSETTPLVIIDDAIDSGKSMAVALGSALKLGLSRAHIKVVVIVHTLPEPRVQADYWAYQDILLRFPWSADARQHDS